MIIIDNENVQVIKLEIEIESTGHITNTYVIKDQTTSKVCVLDPAFDAEKIRQVISEINGKLELVLITHSHADHIAALAELVNGTNISVYIHKLDGEGLYDELLNEQDVVGTKVLPVQSTSVILLRDKDTLTFGQTVLEVIHTPGHTQGSISLLDEKNNILYSGDTIFENTYGRTDLITGSRDDMKQSLDKLFDRFDDIQVLSGHGNIFNLKDAKRKIRLLFAYKG